MKIFSVHIVRRRRCRACCPSTLCRSSVVTALAHRSTRVIGFRFWCFWCYYVSDRGEVQKGSAETFFRKVKFWKEDAEGDAPPVFNVDGVNYFHVKVAGLLFVATTRVNVSPSLVLELLQRIARVIKDYLGVLNEDSFRKNFVLVYELLDEVIDFGYAQTTSTEVLKSYVFNEPIVIDTGRLPPLGPASIFMQGTKRMPGTAITKSVVANEPSGRKRDEVFVDVIEKISVTFNSSGYILTSEIDGTIQMKSYLTGNPEIRLALNEDLSIGTSDYRGSGAVILDDCNFHESVHLDSFDIDRTLSLVPPDGEFPVMNYRMTQPFKPPFRINALIEEAGPLKAEVTIKVRADFNSSINANTVLVQMPLPKFTTCFDSFCLSRVDSTASVSAGLIRQHLSQQGRFDSMSQQS